MTAPKFYLINDNYWHIYVAEKAEVDIHFFFILQKSYHNFLTTTVVSKIRLKNTIFSSQILQNASRTQAPNEAVVQCRPHRRPQKGSYSLTKSKPNSLNGYAHGKQKKDYLLLCQITSIVITTVIVIDFLLRRPLPFNYHLQPTNGPF